MDGNNPNYSHFTNPLNVSGNSTRQILKAIYEKDFDFTIAVLDG
jgi:hypothetical protein